MVQVLLLLDCGGLNSPENSAVDTTAATTYGKTATYGLLTQPKIITGYK